MRARPPRLVLLALLAACGDSESPCYAPEHHDYAGTVRAFAEADNLLGALALPDGQVFVLTSDGLDAPVVARRLDRSGELVELARWDGLWGPMTRLADGRVAVVDNQGCGSVVVDPRDPGPATVRACELAGFYPSALWPDRAGRVLMLGKYIPDARAIAGVFALDLARGEASRVAVDDTYYFSEAFDRPLQLCDGRIVLGTYIDGGDFFAPGPAIYQFDPASDTATPLELPYNLYRMAQFDPTTALAIGYDPEGNQVLFELDIETGVTTPISPPTLGDDLSVYYRQMLIGLADGTALVVAADGGLHRYLPAEQRTEPLGVGFSDVPRYLVRRSDGPVLAFQDDGRVEMFE